MSVSSVSGAAASFPQPSAQDSALRTAFQQLTSAISSGDLDAAKKAYASLTSQQQASGKSDPNDPMSKFLAQLGSDLTSGDMTTAQNDLTSFQKAHRPPHGPPPADSAPPSTSTSSSGANVVDITA